MNKVSVVRAKAHFSEILTMAESGEEILITRRGTPVARITGMGGARKPLRFDEIDKFRASLSPTRERGVELIRRMRDESY